MLKIHRGVMKKILEHVTQTYPHECCGLMVGESYKNKEVTDYRVIPNINKDRAHDRYIMDPKVFNEVDKELRGKKLEILGIYHSHPDHPSRPSEFDRARAEEIMAHEVYSYVVIACEKGVKTQAQSWVLREATNHFEEEELVII